MTDEEKLVRAEDPSFPEVLARSRAKARQEPYNPEVHGPFEAKLKPRAERHKPAAPMQDLREVLARIRAMGGRRIEIARPDVERVREL